MIDRKSELVDRVLDVQEAIMRVVASEVLADWRLLDLSMAQMKTLIALEQETPVTIGQVARALGVGPPTASHLVDRLVQTGLAVRAEDVEDRRRTLARLSPQGRDLLEGCLRLGHSDQWRSWLARMDEADLGALLQGLLAVVRAMGADLENAEDKPVAPLWNARRKTGDLRTRSLRD